MKGWSAAPIHAGRGLSLATEPKKPASTGKTAARAAKSAPAAELKAIEARLTALESGLEAADRHLAERTAALESRIGAVEDRGSAAPAMQMPEGFVNTVRHWLDRAAELIRRNPITALILIVAFLLVALFS